jgi:4-amino-4-deoxy-L-arabinose transferase-like glycosyltransferase
MTARDARVWLAVCVTVGAILATITIGRTSITDDEPGFFSYGARIWRTASFRRLEMTDDSKLPVSALHALPGVLGATGERIGPAVDRLLSHWWAPQEATYIGEHVEIYAGRLVNLVFYVVLCVLVFAWGREVYGPRGALAAAALTAFLPSLIGHTAVMSVDVAATCTMFAAVYALGRCLLDPSLQAALLAGVALGAAQLVTFTALDLVPMGVLMLVARVITATRAESRWRLAHGGVTSVVVAAAAALLVVNLGFGFEGTGARLSDVGCRSVWCSRAQRALGDLRLPLPADYLSGLDLEAAHDGQRSAGSYVYLLGDARRDGFASYFLVATLLKTPLAFLVLLVIRPWRKHRRYSDLMFAIPAFYLFVHLSLFSRAQLGVRFALPAFPFLALLAAANFDDERPSRLRFAALVLLITQVAGTVIVCPRYLAYFNEWIGRRVNAYRYLADSNLDWGQDRFASWAWERMHADVPYVVNPPGPASGLVLVRVNYFVGVDGPDRYKWLRDQAEPLGVVGDSYLLFNVP